MIILFDFLMEKGGMTIQDMLQYTNDFYFRYNIPQLGKEFDLIRIGENYILNIEVKRNLNLEKQRNQIKNNHFYLNFLEKPTLYYSIDVENNIVVKAIENSNNLKYEFSDFKSCKFQV